MSFVAPECTFLALFTSFIFMPTPQTPRCLSSQLMLTLAFLAVLDEEDIVSASSFSCYMEAILRAQLVLDYRRISSPHGLRFVPTDKHADRHREREPFSLFVCFFFFFLHRCSKGIQEAHTYWEERKTLWVGVGRNSILSHNWQQRTRRRPPRHCWGFVLAPLCNFKGCYFDFRLRRDIRNHPSPEWMS